MASDNSLSDISWESASMEIGHIMKPASEWNLNSVSATDQPTHPEEFRFLDLPGETRNKIYGNLLVYHKPVKLMSCTTPKRGEDGYLQQRFANCETRLGMSLLVPPLLSGAQLLPSSHGSLQPGRTMCPKLNPPRRIDNLSNPYNGAQSKQEAKKVPNTNSPLLLLSPYAPQP